MTLHGVDIYVWYQGVPDVPKEHGKLKLILISNRGTRVYPGPVPEIDLLDWPRCRYASDDPVTNDEVDALVRHITESGFNWSKCQKLHRKDGVNQYSEPY